MVNKNTLFIISGCSGAGKTSVMAEVMKASNNKLISFTTRPRRLGEINKEDYYFISDDDYQDLLSTGGIIESTQYPPNSDESHFYGSMVSEFEQKIKLPNPYVITDINGLFAFKEKYDKCVSIWIKSSKDDTTKKLLVRGDSKESINTRLKCFDEEQENSRYYDYVVTNEIFKKDKCVKTIKAIISEWS